MKNFRGLLVSAFFVALGLLLPTDVLYSQVSVNNQGTLGGGCGVSITQSFTVNAGNNRMLVVFSAPNNGITFNGTALTKLDLTTVVPALPTLIIDNLNVFYLNLGSGASITANVVYTCMGTDGGFIPFAFDNVAQTDPIRAATGNDNTTGASVTSSTLDIPTSIGDGILDLIQTGGGGNFTTLVPETGQTGLLVSLSDPAIGTSFKQAIATNTSLSWNLTPALNTFHLGVALKGVNATGGSGVSTTPIPTMSQWGLLIFGLLVMNLSIFFVKRRGLI